jgi:hypothetical protein
MASGPPKTPPEQTPTTEPASPIPAPPEKVQSDGEGDEGEFGPPGSPSTEPVWPT